MSYDDKLVVKGFDNDAMGGLWRITLDDYHGKDFFLQDSSLAYPDTMWIGQPGNTDTMILLDKQRAKVLVKVLKQFLKTGLIDGMYKDDLSSKE